VVSVARSGNPLGRACTKITPKNHLRFRLPNARRHPCRARSARQSNPARFESAPGIGCTPWLAVKLK